MRSIKSTAVLLATLLATLLAAATSTAALADRHGHGGHWHGGPRVSFGLSLGAPLWYPGPVYYPYPAYPYPPVVVQPAPRVYIERDDQAAAQEGSEDFWYYCRESDTYYPYVKQCAGQWERVPARPRTP